MTTTKWTCLIMGAAGRDFHEFQTFFRSHPEFHVVAFTAAQIPFIAARTFPSSRAGSEYVSDIPIYPETNLEELIEQQQIDFVFLAYSDLHHLDVMHIASRVQARGASFVLLGPRHTQLQSSKPVISVTAVRTGAGKSPLTQHLAIHLNRCGYRVGVVRHPMPYGDLTRQLVERIAVPDDLEYFSCTIEEREEYAPYLELGLVVYAGVDYESILREAEKEADVILWDGGNNDFPFIRPDLSIVVADALRPGHELEYYPGETNLLLANVVVINKVQNACPASISMIRDHVKRYKPKAEIIESNLQIEVDRPELISGRSVLVIEDGPTLTHGGMASGAGLLAALKFRAREIVDPRAQSVGTIATAYREYPHIGKVLPALGYSVTQRNELAATINASSAEVIIDASPASLNQFLGLNKPVVRVRYRFQQTSGVSIESIVEQSLTTQPPARPPSDPYQ